MEKSTASPDSYLQSLPAQRRRDMQRLDEAISEAMGDHPRVLWEGRLWGGSDQHIIGYGDYSYTKSNGEEVTWFIVGLAAQQRYLSVYVNAADDAGYLAEQYADRLGKAKVGKSSISFGSLDDIDLPVLVELVGAARRLMTQP